MFKKNLPVIIVLALILSACTFNVTFPGTQQVGPVTTDQISVPLPDSASEPVDLYLAFGAGTLDITPASPATALVSGTATYNIADFKPVITVITGHNIRVEQGNWKLTGIPNLTNIKNEWKLALGSTPVALTIDGGAYQANYEFGGLALTNLTVSDGAAQVKMNFASPNLAEMTLLSYSTGASNVTISGLGNANFSSLEFDSGAGNYTLDFSGQMKRAGSVHIGTGVSNFTLVIPTGLLTQVTVKGGLSNVAYDSAWTHTGSVYSQPGTGPQLTIVVEIGAGNLTLTH